MKVIAQALYCHKCMGLKSVHKSMLNHFKTISTEVREYGLW